MKGCELCGCPARMHCESDQASLCWDCDEKVHGANFLVAKHCRSLLCQVCQSPTPWTASGPKLSPTVSVCESCFSVHTKRNGENSDGREESHGGNDEDEYEDNEEFTDDYDEEDEEEDDEEDGENQVVPWSVASPGQHPVASSSSSEEEISSRFSGTGAAFKRMRENNTDLESDDEIGCSSSHLSYGILSNEEGNSLASLRPSKQPRRDDVEHHGQAESRTAIIDSVKRLQRDLVTDWESASATIVGICRLSRDQSR